MSYDMDIGEESYNYTYNVSSMWYDCFPEKGIRVFYGLSGEDAVELQLQLYNHMVINKERLIEMNPKNGWGDYYGALSFVHELIMASLRNTKEVWEGD